MTNIELEQVAIFTDGACRGNPGPGGWGALIRFSNHEQQIFWGRIHDDQ